jgi:hypothetical protein
MWGALGIYVNTQIGVFLTVRPRDCQPVDNDRYSRSVGDQ